MADARRRNGLEWVVFGLGASMTLAVVLFLVVEAVRGAGEAQPFATAGAVADTPAGREVTVDVENRGDAAALDVVVEVCDAARDCVELVFPQVPGGASQSGRAVFRAGSSGFSATVSTFRVP